MSDLSTTPALPRAAEAVLRAARVYNPQPVYTYHLLYATRGDLNKLLDALLTLEVRGLIRWTRPRLVRMNPTALDLLRNIDRAKRIKRESPK